MQETIKGDARMARRFNDRLALDLLAQSGTLNRSELRRATGLTQPTIIELVRRLEARDLIREVGPPDIRRPGRPARVYEVSGEAGHVAAVHLTGSKLSARVGDLVNTDHPIVTAKISAAPLEAQLTKIITRALTAAKLDHSRLSLVVIGTHGAVDRMTNDLGINWDLSHWQGHVRRPLQEMLDMPVLIFNEVSLVAMAEGQLGAAQGRDRYGLLWAGYGLRHSIIRDGAPDEGTSGAAGEVGYLPVPGVALKESDGTLHDYSLGYGGLARYEALRQVAAEHGLGDGPLEKALQKATSADDDHSQAFLAEVARRVATGLASIVVTTDPGLVVLSGQSGYAGGPVLAGLVQDQLRRFIPFETTVVAGSLSMRHDPTLTGALVVGRRHARELVWGPPVEKQGDQ